MKNTTFLPFQDINLPLEDRVSDLVLRFTLEEKICLMVQYQPEISRLGVKAYKHGTEAAHGIAWLGDATSFPQPIGLGCTWNPDLMKEIGSVIGDEARIYFQKDPSTNGLTLWAPTVDMERDPRWGRTEEAYGEDPYLTGKLTASLVKGMQGDHPFFFKAVATLKHFLGNNNEINRGECSASIDPRNMREYYLKAFEPAFVEGGAKSMMTAYNSINGTPALFHPFVNEVVKEEWGMDGFVVSDAGDLLGVVNDHKYYESHTLSVADAIKGGIDSITDDAETSCQAIREALAQQLLSEEDLDRALRNTFRVRFRLGEFDPAENNPYAYVDESLLCSEKHRSLSLQAAKESIVLLKNEHQTLPLNKEKINQLAVIGPLGDIVYRDWYSGSHPYQVTPLQGIKNKLNKSVVFKDGCDKVKLKLKDNQQYVGIENNETKVLAASRNKEQSETFHVTDWGFGEFTLKSLSTGKYVTTDDKTITASADDIWGWFTKEVFRIIPQNDNEVGLRTWNDNHVSIDKEANVLHESKNIQEAAVFTKEVVENGLEEAINAAKESDVAVVFVGNHPLINGKETIDRSDLNLGAYQEKLVKEVNKANPNTVVIVVGSYPFSLNWIDENIPVILYTSHAGQELGNAVSDVLFGDFSPSGRLNMTWYRSSDELPDIMDYDIIKGKRTYQYFDGKPLYPFGYGLTYTSFHYTNLEISQSEISSDGKFEICVQVENNGPVASDEVVQLYVRDDQSRVTRPIKELKGFKRIHLNPGQMETVRFELAASDLAFWDVTRNQYCVESGTFTIMIGQSSEDIKLSDRIIVHGEEIPSRNLLVVTKAENYDDYEGIYLDESKEGFTCVRPVSDGSWIAFHDVDFGEGVSTFIGRISSTSNESSVDVRVDHEEGPLLGTCHVPNTGERQAWMKIETELIKIKGIHNVFLVFKGDVNLSWLKFE